MASSPPREDRGAPSDGQLGLLLACFNGRKTAGKARHSLSDKLRAQGDELLDLNVLEVDEKHKATTHDPRKVKWATVSAALVWGACGLAGANGVWSILFWGAVGAVGAVLFMYYSLRHLTKSELARIGSELPAQSSALAVWVGTTDARRLLEAAASSKPSGASAAAIGADLSTHVFSGAGDTVEVPPGSGDELRTDDTVLSLVLLRYPRPETAKQMVSQPPIETPLEVEMMIRSDADGRRHVSDPYFGVKAAAKSDALWWAGFGLVFGALAGAAGGGAALGLIEGGVRSAIVWGVVGLGAGALYGAVVLKAFSARSLKSVGSFAAPGTSIVMAWVDAQSPLTKDVLDAYSTPGSQRLLLNFKSDEHGVALEAARAAS